MIFRRPVELASSSLSPPGRVAGVLGRTNRAERRWRSSRAGACHESWYHLSGLITSRVGGYSELKPIRRESGKGHRGVYQVPSCGVRGQSTVRRCAAQCENCQDEAPEDQ